jgi:hypothetical protein
LKKRGTRKSTDAALRSQPIPVRLWIVRADCNVNELVSSRQKTEKPSGEIKFTGGLPGTGSQETACRAS